MAAVQQDRQLNVWVSGPLHKAATLHAYEEHGSLSDLVRRAVFTYIDARSDDPAVQRALAEAEAAGIPGLPPAAPR